MSGLHRLLTRRERLGKHEKHGKRETSGVLCSPHYRGLFVSGNTSSDDYKDEDKKIKTLERRIAEMGISELKVENIQYALRTKYADGDVDKAFEMLLLLEDSIEGIIREYTPNTKLLGAENREGVTCYLDALLFAMFARLDCFEAILYKSFYDEPRRKLSAILRLWVNILRSGKLITTDITKHLQDALAECGWKEAAELRQQDASEAFTFITEKLDLPLLTLKMDIYHTGKEDTADDHKFVNERLLEVAIPPRHGDEGILTLESCLEAYFNNRIEVKRYLERQSTIDSMKSFDSTSKGFTTHVEAVELGSPAASPIRSTSSRVEEGTPLSSVTDQNYFPSPPTRQLSIMQERFIPDKDGQIEGDDTTFHRPRLRKGSVRKEVMMPAWQFFSLIPWYTDNAPTNDAQVAAHFASKRPMLGICLKRYSMLPNGKAIRLNTFIDIPIEIGLPHFIQDDKMDDEGPIYGNFKLSLQAVVCHRGVSVNSGHYIALVRGTSLNSIPSNADNSGQSKYQEPKCWMRFDDLAAERITLVDIEQALKEESPYLLFYQILPISEDFEATSLRDELPSYHESEEDQDSDIAAAPVTALLSYTGSGYGEQGQKSTVGATRLSFEANPQDTSLPLLAHNRGVRKSVAIPCTIGDLANLGTTLQIGTTFTSSTASKIEDNRNPSFSRTSSRYPKSRSRARADAQGNDNRLSATLSRLTGRMNKEKPPDDDNGTDGDGEEAATDPIPNDRKHATSTNDGEEKDHRIRSRRGSEKHLGKKPRIQKHPNPKKSEATLPDRECIVM